MPAPKGNQHAKGNKGGGNTTLYKEEYNKKVYKLALLGLTDEQIADILEVTRQTLNNWKTKNPKFKEMLNKGKVEADAKVAHMLFKRATGYQHKEDKIFVHEGIPVIVPTIKKYAPCPVSAKFWLNNRQPDKWRDKREEEEKKEDEIDFSRLSTSEIKEYLAIRAKARK